VGNTGVIEYQLNLSKQADPYYRDSLRRPLSHLFLPSERNARDQKGDDVDNGPVDDHGTWRDTDKRHTS